MKTKSNSIDLGYVHMSSYKPGSKLDEYAEEDGRVSPDPKEIVLNEGTYELEITYPLSNPFKGKFKVGKRGLSREKLVEKVIASYNHIYATEDGDVGAKTGNIPGMLNRARSNGRYGIWGHDMSDLMLHTAYVTGKKVEVSCDS
jgi:hypothetical protein